ncbi:hypothetical protein VNO78_18002 [Psophocarpus tetragonolobus]|uniref:Uncharacterized protein n=1 Tax=Psophocarpus tetragonolobus TaxID=3891 RepID=A0AAN9SI03_PSOTE
MAKFGFLGPLALSGNNSLCFGKSAHGGGAMVGTYMELDEGDAELETRILMVKNGFHVGHANVEVESPTICKVSNLLFRRFCMKRPQSHSLSMECVLIMGLELRFIKMVGNAFFSSDLEQSGHLDHDECDIPDQAYEPHRMGVITTRDRHVSQRDHGHLESGGVVKQYGKPLFDDEIKVLQNGRHG